MRNGVRLLVHRSRIVSLHGFKRRAKYQTRRALIRGALQLMASGKSFGELSLRSIAREAGVVPTAFYRHFADMDELGQSLVDETFVALRRMMREVWRQSNGYRHVIRTSVEVYLDYVQKHPDVFVFFVRERHGGSAALRAAIGRELDFFVQMLDQAIADEPRIAHMTPHERAMFAHLIVATVVNLTGDLVDQILRGEKDLDAVAQRAMHQLRLIALGARIWNREDG